MRVAAKITLGWLTLPVNQEKGKPNVEEACQTFGKGNCQRLICPTGEVTHNFFSRHAKTSTWLVMFIN